MTITADDVTFGFSTIILKFLTCDFAHMIDSGLTPNPSG
jgi:hypothetical protein